MPSPIRVTFCLDNMGIGGTELNAVRVAEALDPARFCIQVACLKADGPLAARYTGAGIPIHEFSIGSLQSARAFRQGMRFAALLRRERIEVVHSHDRYANVFAVPWARIAGVRRVVASKRWGEIGKAHELANKAAFHFAHRVLANSPVVAATLVQAEGVRPQRVVTIPNFVDDDAFDTPSADWTRALRETLALPDDALIVGIVANLRPVKDHATLLRAFAKVKASRSNLFLVLVGSGEEEESLRFLVERLGISASVRFAGTLANRPNIHALFDVSALSSRSEGFPNSLVEAMAAGKPVVSTSVGGVPDAVDDGATGFLVPPADPAAFAAALETVLDSQELRVSMGARAQSRARARFGIRAVVPLIEELYQGARRLAW